MIRRPACALAASACLVHPPALTQPAADPLDPKAPVPAAIYASPLPPRASAAVAPVPWREANERVGRIGGWRAYAREAAGPAAAPASAPAAHHRHHHGPSR